MVTAIILAGVFRGIQEIRLFKQIDNIIFEWFREHGKRIIDFYSGGSSIWQCFWGEKTPKLLRYNPKLPITTDFWHLMKDCEVYCWSYAVTQDWLWAFIAYAGFMVVFVIFYSYILPINKKGNFKELVLDLLNVFQWRPH
jgi:hypothetical protein